MTENNKHPDSIDKQYRQVSAILRRNRGISPFWLLPFIALCIGALLFFQIVQEQGKSIRITFNSGEGLVAGKTQVRYQGLQIGEVKKVNFTDNMKKVEVMANIYPEAESVLRKNTKFWLVNQAFLSPVFPVWIRWFQVIILRYNRATAKRKMNLSPKNKGRSLRWKAAIY